MYEMKYILQIPRMLSGSPFLAAFRNRDTKLHPALFQLRWTDQSGYRWLTKLTGCSVSWPGQEFLLCTCSRIADFTVRRLWQCVPYILLLTASSDPSFGLCSCVLLRSNCLLKWESFSPLCLGSRWKRNTGWHRVASADGGSLSLSLSLPAKIPQQW